MTDHVVPKKIYFTIFAALMVLTVLTIWVAFFDLGALNTVIALTIAVVKAMLVVLYFMHLRYSSRLVQTVAAAAIFWFALLIVLTLADFLTR